MITATSITRRAAGWLAAIAFASGTAWSDGDKCRPAASVGGEPAVVAAAVSELVKRGIDVGPTPGCPAVHVVVAREDDLLAVDIIDPAGRTSHRTVANVGEAASVIDSWIRSDADLLAGFEVAAPVIPPALEARPPTAAAARGDLVSRVAIAPPERGRSRDRITASIAGELAIDGAATSWTGVVADVCGKFGPTCIGLGGAYRITSDRLLSDVSLLAGVEVPVAIGSVVLSPRLAAGLGAALIAPSIMSESPNTQLGARADAGVVASFPLGRHVFLEVAAGVLVLPLAHTGQQEGAAANSGPNVLFHASAGLQLGAP